MRAVNAPAMRSTIGASITRAHSSFETAPDPNRAPAT